VDKDAPTAAVDAQLDEEVRKKLERATAGERARLEQANLEALPPLERDLRAELQAALNRTYRRALEQRAQQLGEVEAVRETGDPRGSYEVTITVRA
jgi:hypothetical protein